MAPDTTGELVHLLQLSISPIALISGVGLLLLSVTNRLGRVMDRTRLLANLLEEHPGPADARRTAQLVILGRRARLLWISIALVTVTILCSCTMMLLLIAMVFYQFELRGLTVVVFSLAAFTMLLSALFFFADVLLGLRAVRVEVGDAWRGW